MTSLRSDRAAMEHAAESKDLKLQTVTWVHHWTPGLFSFRVERPQSFRFSSGEFVMIGVRRQRPWHRFEVVI